MSLFTTVLRPALEGAGRAVGPALPRRKTLT